MIDKPLALFLAGTNGSGKSTIRDNITKKVFSNLVVIDPDKLAKQFNSDNAKGAREAIRIFKDCIANKKPFTMETTLTGNSVLKRLQEAKDSGFNVVMLYVGLSSAQLNVQRVAYRVSQGGHDIPKDTIIQRYNTSRENLIKAINIADIVEIYDNSDSYKLDMVLKQNIMYRSDNMSQWVEQISNEIRLNSSLKEVNGLTGSVFYAEQTAQHKEQNSAQEN